MALFVQIVSNLVVGGLGALMISGWIGFTLILVPLLLWLGFLNHTTPERTPRRVLAQAATIALVIVAGMVLASRVGGR